jgi:hypothetical protein
MARKKYDDLKSKHKKVIDDNKHFRSVNKGLSLLINEVIKCISEAINNEKDQTLVFRLLKILNSHHSQLLEDTVNRGESFLNCTSESMSTTTEEVEKENIFKPKINHLPGPIKIHQRVEEMTRSGY